MSSLLNLAPFMELSKMGPLASRTSATIGSFYHGLDRTVAFAGADEPSRTQPAYLVDRIREDLEKAGLDNIEWS